MKLLPSTKQLQYLVALAQTEHFSRASQVCNVTQSTLSAGIRELETILGVELAERTKRTVIMTPIGRQIASRAAKIITDAQDIMDLCSISAGPLTGHLHLGVIPTIAPYLLPHLFPLLRHSYPLLDLRIRETQTAVLVEEVLSGQLDVALLALPASDGKLVEKPLFEDPFVLLTPAGHSLARQSTIKAETLSDETLLLLEEGHCFRDQAIEFCTSKGIHAGLETGLSTLGATSLTTITQMVAADFGITLLPQMAVQSETANNAHLAVRPFADPAPSRSIGLMWRKSSPRAADFDALAKIICASKTGEN